MEGGGEGGRRTFRGWDGVGYSYWIFLHKQLPFGILFSRWCDGVLIWLEQKAELDYLQLYLLRTCGLYQHTNATKRLSCEISHTLIAGS